LPLDEGKFTINLRTISFSCLQSTQHTVKCWIRHATQWQVSHAYSSSTYNIYHYTLKNVLMPNINMQTRDNSENIKLNSDITNDILKFIPSSLLFYICHHHNSETTHSKWVGLLYIFSKFLSTRQNWSQDWTETGLRAICLCTSASKRSTDFACKTYPYVVKRVFMQNINMEVRHNA